MMQSHYPTIVVMGLFHLAAVFGFVLFCFVCFVWFAVVSFCWFGFALFLFGMVMASLDCILVLLQHGLLWPIFSNQDG